MNQHLYTITKEKKQPGVVRLKCKNEESWPPAEEYLNEHPERLRQRNVITEHVYEANKVWRRECGKREMDDGCATCPHARVNARVKNRETGRISYKDIEFVPFLKQSRTDIQLVYEKVPPNESQAPG